MQCATIAFRILVRFTLVIHDLSYSCYVTSAVETASYNALMVILSVSPISSFVHSLFVLLYISGLFYRYCQHFATLYNTDSRITTA